MGTSCLIAQLTPLLDSYNCPCFALNVAEICFLLSLHTSSPHCSDIVNTCSGRQASEHASLIRPFIPNSFCRGREEVIYFYKLVTGAEEGNSQGALLYRALGSDAFAPMKQRNSRFGVSSDIMPVLCTWTLWLPSSTGICFVITLLAMLVW